MALLLTGAEPVDGDTLRQGDLRVRLFGIDAPERSDPLGPAATRALRALIAGQTLTCDNMGTDRYGRTVARCDLPDGRDVACELVAMGMARDWPRYSNGVYAGCGE